MHIDSVLLRLELRVHELADLADFLIRETLHHFGHTVFLLLLGHLALLVPAFGEILTSYFEVKRYLEGLFCA